MRRTRSGNFPTLHVKSQCSRRYPCEVCGRFFSIRASLVRHRIYECVKRKMKKEDIKTEKAETKKIDREEINPKKIKISLKGIKKHVCSKCHKSYTFFTSLWRHQHYECDVERRFHCSHCHAKFSQKSNLDRHARAKHSTLRTKE